MNVRIYIYIYIRNEETRNTVNFCDLDAILGAAILNFLFRTHYVLKFRFRGLDFSWCRTWESPI